MERKRHEAVIRAFELLEQHPNFSAARVRVHDREQDAEKSTPGGPLERLSEPRFEYCIKLFDIEGEEYLQLVASLESAKAYATIMDDLARRVFILFSGLPLEAVPPTSPFATGPTPHLLLYRDRLLKRMRYWVIEAHRRLSAFEGQPKEQRNEVVGVQSLAYRLDEAVACLDITHDEMARRIGIGKTTYFAVKGGGGKRSTQLRVEQYLCKLDKPEP